MHVPSADLLMAFSAKQRWGARNPQLQSVCRASAKFFLYREGDFFVSASGWLRSFFIGSSGVLRELPKDSRRISEGFPKKPQKKHAYDTKQSGRSGQLLSYFQSKFILQRLCTYSAISNSHNMIFVVKRVRSLSVFTYLPIIFFE